ncbi:MAG: lipoate--protein ligase family protein, partial [Gemmatimonadales bacterium]
GWLRLYAWTPHCISFGAHEPALRRYDRETITGLGLDCVRRPTGGRAVWHAGELTYAVTAPLAAFGGLRAAYHEIHQTFGRALGALGIETTAAPLPARSAGLATGACFAHAAGGELIAGGGKVLGSAQLARGAAFLQHGSLLLSGTQDTISRIARGGSSPAGDLALEKIAGRPVSFEEVAEAVADAALSWPGEWDNDTGDGALHRLESQHAGQFRDPAWTWRR